MSANTFENALNHLWRGGRYAYFWSLANKRSQWFDVADVPSLPTGRDVYFCVHPSASIPRVNTQGEEVEPANVRSRNGTIAAINCLYSEVDAPDDLDAAFHAVNSLEPSPTMIVRSGGGFHLYWFLTEPYTLDTAQKRAYARDLQSRWVTHTGGDKAAKDLARVLRVPGTLNGKYEPPRAVEIVAYESSRLYELQSLVNVLPKRTKATQTPVTATQTPVNGIVDKMFASKHGAEIQALWNGDTSAYNGDHSAADLALMNRLAFYTRKDAGAMEQLFGESHLGKRDKWLNRPDYRLRTIEAAIAGTTEVYTNGNGAHHAQTTPICRAQSIGMIGGEIVSIDVELSKDATNIVGVPVRVSWVSMTDAAGKAYTLPDAYGLALNPRLRGDRVKTLSIFLHECGHIANKHVPSMEWARKRATLHNPAVATPDVFDRAWWDREAGAWEYAIKLAKLARWDDVGAYCKRQRMTDFWRYVAAELELLTRRLERLERTTW